MSPLLDDAALATDLVREAGALAAELRADGLRTEQKTSPSDVVTAADRAAERLIADQLAAMRPDDGLLGEEGSARPSVSGRTWVIDPVDGTYNFVRGLPWWCSAVALVAGDPDGEHELLLGAVHQPETGVLHVGGPDLPPTRDGELLARPGDRPLARSCLATYLHPPFHAAPAGRAFVALVERAETLRMLGSGTADLLAVAEGRMDVFVQHSVPAWDWLPGAAIVRGVGGSARQVLGAGVVWSVAGAPTAVEEACAVLQEAPSAEPGRPVG
ncbi:MAG: inositol monophosphatase family protein [Marmoricola sp.]